MYSDARSNVFQPGTPISEALEEILPMVSGEARTTDSALASLSS